MVKASKFLVLAAGLMGLMAIFQPYSAGTNADGTVISWSTRDLIAGLVRAGQDSAKASNRLEGSIAALEAADAVLWLPVLLPIHGAALVLVLLGIWGVIRGRFGRFFGLLSLILGAFIFIFWGLVAASQETDAALPGLTLFLGAGVAALVGGLVALIKPQRVAPKMTEPELAEP